jgi:hypothetical protein
MTNPTFPGKKIFPIKSDTACMLKWGWSSIWLNTGTTASCHRCSHDAIDPENFDNFHNIPQKIQARELMQQGHWPQRGCQYCETIEKNGGMSDRLMQLSRDHVLDKIPPELLENPLATSVTPTTLEVWFNNTCNMTCTYCGPEYSSKWADELKKYGPIKIENLSVTQDYQSNPHYDRMVAELWNYLDSNNRSSVIRHFQILGGEPLLQKEFDQVIDFWEQHPNPSLTINVISNLMIPHDRFVQKIQRFQALVDKEAILKLQLTASLDGWGPAQEYVRHGLDLEIWEKNFRYLLDKSWCQPSINSCITSLSIKDTPALLEKINQWNMLTNNSVHWSFETITGNFDSGQNHRVFGPDFFAEDFDKILSSMSQNTEDEKLSYKHMQGIALTQANSVAQPDKINNLKNYLDELDRRRGLNWRQLFPWLK